MHRDARWTQFREQSTVYPIEMSHADWHSLGEVSYRKFPLYESMGWGTTKQIEDYILCGSTFGGPIAMMKSNRKVMMRNATSTPEESKSRLQLYTSAGVEIAEIEWESKRVTGMGWTDREELMIVSEDGKKV